MTAARPNGLKSANMHRVNELRKVQAAIKQLQAAGRFIENLANETADCIAGPIPRPGRTEEHQRSVGQFYNDVFYRVDTTIASLNERAEELKEPI